MNMKHEDEENETWREKRREQEDGLCVGVFGGRLLELGWAGKLSPRL